MREKVPKKILLVRTDRIGDVILTTPAIRALRKHFPASYLAMMVQSYTADVIKNNPYLNEVIIYDKGGRHKSILASLKFANDLARKKFDLVFIFHPTNRVNIITFLAGIPERIGYNKKFGFLLTRKIKDEKYKGEKHEIEYNLDIIKIRGVGAFEKEPEIFLSDEDKQYAEKFLEENQLNGNVPIVALQPGASCPSRRWPVENFAEMGMKLKEFSPVNFMIIGGNEESFLLEELKRLLGGKAIIVQGMDLGKLAAILKQASLFISTDTGPAHIAAAVKTPGIVIFGRKQPGLSPRRWRPWGNTQVIFHRDVGCDICLAHNCDKGFKCLKAVTPQEVFKAAQKIVERKND